eukprot:Blabericola_migrator_1__1926@NODE_1523_length_4348_cov_17_645176_g557_i4_p10_GENE_NODE_1523_length_4348_cov_17_645176_g557_i4NODE_1523_length_4348_cov_17_645176_g557_i4_p10_ORF_typecomplete_len100_score13_82RNA_GG_bind/PF10258_9/0_08RST/PF12174_8/0_094_NODE_1523_length_4348_cov_17_645176_g557_i414721771
MIEVTEAEKAANAISDLVTGFTEDDEIKKEEAESLMLKLTRHLPPERARQLTKLMWDHQKCGGNHGLDSARAPVRSSKPKGDRFVRKHGQSQRSTQPSC